MTRLRSITLSGVAILACLGCGPAQAGFFDELGEMFGGRGSRSYERSYERSRPMYIRVSPRRYRMRPTRMVRRDRRKPEVVKAAVIDPAKDPQWFLHDPTLRRGDIVVVKDDVLVFDSTASAKTHELEDFVSLQDAAQVPKSTRLMVEKLATAPSRSDLAIVEPVQ